MFRSSYRLPFLATTGANLVHKKTISLMDALLGFERRLTLLDGRRVPIVHDQVLYCTVLYPRPLWIARN